MTRIAFENTIRSVLQSLLPTTVLAIFADENGPRPSAPYLTIKIMEKHPVGSPHYTNTDTQGVQQVRWDEDVAVSIQSFGANAYDILATAVACFNKETVLTVLQAAEIAIRSAGAVRDLTELLDSVFEKRASVDMVFGIAQSISDTVGWIERADIEQVG